MGDGDDTGDGRDDGGDRRIFPGHPSPILHAPRDIISRKGKSLTPIYIYIYRERERVRQIVIYIYIYISEGGICPYGI